MAKTLLVKIADEPTPDIVHRFRNFGEDVYRALRDRCEIDLDEIDASTNHFLVGGIKARDVRRVAKIIRKELDHHNFGQSGSVVPE